MARILISLGALNAAIVVIIGAYGAHALKGQLAPEQAASFQTAVQYHMFHALGLIVVGVVATLRPGSTLLTWSGGLMFLGIVLFCGSLYLSTLGGWRAVTAAAPYGGTAFIISWLLLAISVARD